jgi:nucleoside-diphosphate-sugar epimerase
MPGATEPSRRILVTGAGGFSGSVLVQKLLKHGYHVVAVAGRRSLGRLPSHLLSDRALTVLQGDLCSELELPLEIAAVVHAAARSPEPGVGAADFARDNVLATLRVVQHARRVGVEKFIYLSSLSVFGHVDTAEVDETTPTVDPDAYGATKLVGEQLLQEETNRFASIALRLPGVIGPASVRNWLSSIMAKARAGTAIDYHNPDAPFNNAVHVDELAEFVLGLLDRRWQGFDMLTLAAAGETTVRHVVETIVAAAGTRSALRTLDIAQRSFVVSSRKAMRLYRYRPSSIEALISRFTRENL